MTQQVSKTTVVMTLIAAIIISLGGTISVLTKLSSFTRYNPEQQLAGFATDEPGYVQINISRFLSIDVQNNTIDFGTCTPVPPGNVTQISSEMNETDINETTLTNCTGTTSGLPAHISIINDGTLPANVTVYTDALGFDILNDPDATFAYRTINATIDGGCTTGNNTPDWTNFTTTGSGNKYNVCRLLKVHYKDKAVWFYANFTITSLSYTLGGVADLTFEGSQPI